MKKHTFNWPLVLTIGVLGAIAIIRGVKWEFIGTFPVVFFAGTISAKRKKKDGEPLAPEDQVEAELAKIVPGQISINCPDQMIVGWKRDVRIGISKKLTEAELKELARVGYNKTSEIKVGTFMEVSLVGDAFTIESYSKDKQVVPKNQVVTWEWGVTPLKSGTQTLVARVNIILKLEKSEENHNLSPYTKEVTVKVDVREVLMGYLREVLRLAIEHWKESGAIVALFSMAAYYVRKQ